MCRAILAGGGFTRMGTNEALLPFGGVGLIETLLQALRPLFRETAIVAKDLAGYAVLGVAVWCDRIPERGALGDLQRRLPGRLPTDLHRLRHAGLQSVGHRLHTGCRVGLRCRGSADSRCMPAASRRLQQELLPHMEGMMRGNHLRVNRLFSAVRLQTVEVEELRPMDPALLCFVNVNTRQGLEAAARLAGRID